MPRATFTNTALRAASPGLGRLAASIGNRGEAYGQGYDQETQSQTRMAQALAQIRQADSSAALNDAKAATEGQQQGVLASRPQLYEEQVAAASGADIPLVKAIRDSLRTGQTPGMQDMGPPAEDGSMGARAVPADIRTKVAGALQQFLPLLSNTGDLKPDDLAQAAKLYRESGLSDRIIDGTLDRNRVGGAQAAVAGKALFNADSTGAVLDQYGGGLDTKNPMAGATINLRDQQAAQARAAAAENYAQAANARATENQTRNAPKGMLVQTSEGPVFANPITGEATPVTVGGVRTKGGSKGGSKGGGAMSATLQKELIDADDTAAIADQTVATLTNALALNDKAYSGLGATTRAKIVSNLGGSPEADATVQLNNMIGEQALSGMKAIFGGNPTEGERAILLELQASADKTPAQRKAIIERGIQLAQRRAKINRERAKAIRSGDYLTEGAPEVADPNAPVAVTNDADYAALPAGARFVTPDGKTGTKR